MFEALYVLVAFYCVFKIHDLQNRLTRVEKNSVRVCVDENSRPKEPITISENIEKLPDPLRAPLGIHESLPSSYPPLQVVQKSSGLIEWFIQDWPMKIGAFFLLIALGWFTTYAFMNDWIGPVGRISLGLIVSTGIMMLGAWRISAFQKQGAILLALGAAGVCMTVFVAQNLYQMFPSIAALGICFLVSVAISFFSILHKSRYLGLAGILLSALSPALVNASSSDGVGLFCYLLVICIGALWVVWYTGWQELVVVSLLIVSLYSFPYWEGSGTMTLSFAQFVMHVFFFLYFVTTLASIKIQKTITTYHIVTAVLSFLFVLFWIFAFTPEIWQSLHVLAIAFLSSVACFLFYTTYNLEKPLYLYAPIALSLVGIATFLQFPTDLLTLIFSLEVLIFVLLLRFLVGNISFTSNASTLIFFPMLLSIKHIDTVNWWLENWQYEALVLTVVMFVFAIFAYILWDDETLHETTSSLPMIYAWIAVGYGVILVWQIFHALFLDGSFPVVVSLLIYTITGISLYLVGKEWNKPHLISAGGVFLIAVTLRLLFVEIWEMEMTGKIVIFTLIGALFIATAFIGKQSSSDTPL